MIKIDFITLGKRIEFLRGAATQTDFAHKYGLSQVDISRLEKGLYKKPDIDILYKICIDTKKSLNWLLTGIDTEEIEVYNEDERKHCKHLLRIMRTKQEKTVTAIKQNLEAFLDTPDKALIVVKKNTANK